MKIQGMAMSITCDEMNITTFIISLCLLYQNVSIH